MFIYSARFKKQFKKLSLKVQSQTLKRLEIFLADQFDPILNNHSLHGEYSGYRSINVSGDIRLVYKEIDKNNHHLIAIGSHSELYE